MLSQFEMESGFMKELHFAKWKLGWWKIFA